MTNLNNHAGSCLCGGVKYTVTSELEPVMFCHCGQCRKTSGHYVAATACAPEALQLDSAETLSWYRASDTAVRGFCNNCGGNLFWQPDKGDHISIFAGTLDKPTGIRGSCHVFVDEKSDYFDINDGLPQHAGWGPVDHE